jgi:hypothetical protein
MTLRQRQPRVTDEAWLAEVRKLPCTICHRPGPNDPAHIRSSGARFGYNKRYTGMGEKPDDRWVLPLCRAHHDEQHGMAELGFWARYGINPFLAASELYATRPPRREPRRRIVKTVTRKPKSERRSIGKGPPLQSANRLPPKGSVKFQKRRAQP